MLIEPGKRKAGEEPSKIKFTPEFFRVVEKTVQKDLKKYKKHSQESVETVVGNVITRLVKWVGKQIGSASEDVINDSLIKIGVRTSQNESKRYARTASIHTISIDDCSETLAYVDAGENTEAEEAEAAFKLWKLFKRISFRQRAAILFGIKDKEYADFLVLLVEYELVSVNDLSTTFQSNEDDLIPLLKSLPWKDSEIAAYITSREAKTCTAKNVVDARYSGRIKIFELQVEENSSD